MDNLETYNKLKEVPSEAKKEITGGRLNGMTAIEPMWRIKKLTEEFGVCGIGWKTEIVKKEITEGADGQMMATVDIKLYIKVDGEWSDAIPGTGGSMFVVNEKKGPYVSDECFKMAYTDAISVASKSIGLAADVYFGNDPTNKYSKGKMTLNDHDIYAIQKRMQEKYTKAIQIMGSSALVADKIGETEKAINKMLTDYFKNLALLEKRIDEI